ncbi:FadR/GntR family transcriptional regulator [Amycolatopsis sp. GM8]|uniref:FadR/GntR family transcriptional regulator n=1 Tax=Amycolatopsis sp. GM8 TaxID=2896530 RepID=UPI001F3A0DC6|nr:FCD domain-containing protein [Amycolatopsis sp. GM8]
MSADHMTPGGLKRAEQVAVEIEKRIIDLRWPIGELIGSEQSLIEEYNVSRGVLREAIRLLEHHGTARMRRGPGGGLFVTPPDPHGVRRSAALYLRYGRTDVASLAAARKSLELDCLDLVGARLNDPAVSTRLRRALEIETAYTSAEGTGSARHLRNFHLELAELTGNPAISLFTEILMELQAEFTAEANGGPQAGEVRAAGIGESHHAHQAIYHALVNGDLDVAKKRMSRHLDGIASYTAEHGAATDAH